MGNNIRILNHPILGKDNNRKKIKFVFNGKEMIGLEGDTIATALIANGIKVFQYTDKGPRGIFCGIGRCNECIMKVNGNYNVITCKTDLQEGMIVVRQ